VAATLEAQEKKCAHAVVRDRQLVRYTLVHVRARKGPCVRVGCECGNPAVVGARREWRCVPVDRRLCVPAFRRVCRYHFLLLPGFFDRIDPGRGTRRGHNGACRGKGERIDDQLDEAEELAGNPAIPSLRREDRRLCVAVFRRLCPDEALLQRFPKEFVEQNLWSDASRA
jgi:hypothetical protein